MILILLLVGALGAVAEGAQCLVKGSPFYNLLSTMTPYEDVRGDILKLKGCKAETLWGYVRHATRFPQHREIQHFNSNMTTLRDEILLNHQQRRGSLCPEDLEQLRQWHLVADPNQNMLLTVSGMEELRQFGERLGRAFPILKNNGFGSLDIRITPKERTRQSAQAFATGLYNTQLKIDNTNIRDVLKANGKCPRWGDSKNNAKLKEETEKFKNSKELQKTLERVSKRLGFQEQLDFDVVKDMYDLCGFEYAWYHHNYFAPWCAAFNMEDLQVMEYHEDLRYYYNTGTGNPLTPKIGCYVVRELIEHLSQGGDKSLLNFGHSAGVRTLLTTLGLGYSEPLSGDGFSAAVERGWRSSFLTPFAANVLVARYKCEKGSYGVKDKRRLAVFVNEKLMPLEACGGTLMCSMKDFVNAYAPLTDPSFCNKDFCGSESEKATDVYDKE